MIFKKKICRGNIPLPRLYPLPFCLPYSKSLDPPMFMTRGFVVQNYFRKGAMGTTGTMCQPPGLVYKLNICRSSQPPAGNSWSLHDVQKQIRKHESLVYFEARWGTETSLVNRLNSFYFRCIVKLGLHDIFARPYPGP